MRVSKNQPLGVNFEGRKQLLLEKQNFFYLAYYDESLIGMFSLEPHGDRKKLSYFYVEENFRNHGVGTRMLNKAKRITQAAGCKSIILDTLKPNLNRFYEKNGAVFSGEGYVLNAPADVLNIKCNIK